MEGKGVIRGLAGIVELPERVVCLRLLKEGFGLAVGVSHELESFIGGAEGFSGMIGGEGAFGVELPDERGGFLGLFEALV